MFRPIFIAGCDRSGTTLLGDLLGSAPGAFATPESQWIHDLVPRLHVAAFRDSHQAATWLQAHFRFAVWELELHRDQLAALIDIRDARGSISRIIRQYLISRDIQPDALSVWVDHTPDNFRFQPLLRGVFPDARYIHIVRDGRAVFDSVRTLDWGPNNAYAGTRHWAERLHQGLSVEIAEPESCRRVYFEQLVREPGRTLEALCDFCNLDYREDMTGGGGLIVPGFTRGQHRLVGKRPDPTRCRDWQRRLTSRQIAEFEAYPASRQLLTSLGYRLETDTPARIGPILSTWRHLQDFMRYGWNRILHRRKERSALDAARSGAASAPIAAGA